MKIKTLESEIRRVLSCGHVLSPSQIGQRCHPHWPAHKVSQVLYKMRDSRSRKSGKGYRWWLVGIGTGNVYG